MAAPLSHQKAVQIAQQFNDDGILPTDLLLQPPITNQIAEALLHLKADRERHPSLIEKLTTVTVLTAQLYPFSPELIRSLGRVGTVALYLIHCQLPRAALGELPPNLRTLSIQFGRIVPLNEEDHDRVLVANDLHILFNRCLHLRNLALTIEQVTDGTVLGPFAAEAAELRSLTLLQTSLFKANAAAAVALFPRLQSFKLEFPNSIAESALATLLASGPAELKILYGRIVTDLESDSEEEPIESVVTQLQIRRVSGPVGETLSFFRFPRLRSLSLENLHSLKGRQLAPILVSASDLEEVILDGCDSLSSDNLQPLVSGRHEHLRELSLRGLKLDDAFVAALWKQPSPSKALHLSQTSGLTDSAFADIPAGRPLHSLTLAGIKGLGDPTLYSLSALHELTTLDLSGVTEATDAGLLPLIQKGELVELHLRELPNLTDATIAALNKHCILTTLTLDSNSQLSPEALRSLASQKELRVLSLKETQADDHTVRELTSLPYLEELYLNGSRISEELLATLGCFPSLRSLGIKVSASFPQEALLALKQQHPDLKIRPV